MLLFQISKLFDDKPPKVLLTINQVRKEVGKECGEELAREILKSPDPSAKIKEIKDAFQRIKEISRAEELEKRIGSIGTGEYKNIISILNRNKEIARVFVKNTQEVLDIAEVGKQNLYAGFSSIVTTRALKFFELNPSLAVELAQIGGKYAYSIFYALDNEDFGKWIVKNKENGKLLVGFVIKMLGDDFSSIIGERAEFNILIKNTKKFEETLEMVKEECGKSLSFRYIFRDESSRKDFFNYLEGRLEFDQLLLRIYGRTSVGVERGHPLDQLHDQPEKRKTYLDGLSSTQVLGLLLTDPEYFYTSTNHMLFDRLKKELGEKDIMALLGEMRVPDKLVRNFMLRAINYDRFFGKNDSLFENEDLRGALRVLLEPIKIGNFDEQYYYLIANAFERIEKIPAFRTAFVTEIKKARNELVRTSRKMSEEDIRVWYSLEFLAGKRDLGREEKAYFDPANYKINGKIVVVQIFDREDTEKDHWNLSKRWFIKYEKPKIGSAGEVVYETETAKIILFMGKTEDENVDFVSKMLKENPNLIITFRGHSYSLEGNFPFATFRDVKGHVLFIPGSCGSAGSTARYIANTPDADLRFFSNTSTGRGQVTNTIIDELLRTTRRTRFTEILNRIQSNIAKYGGDITAIKVWDSGQALLDYVYSKTGYPIRYQGLERDSP